MASIPLSGVDLRVTFAEIKEVIVKEVDHFCLPG
jgi:hypothetical protein